MRGPIPLLVLLAILPNAGCVEPMEPDEMGGVESASIAAQREPNATLPAYVVLKGEMTASAGTPTVGPIPFVYARALGREAGTFDVPPGASSLNARVNWSSVAPSRFELHLQSPSVEVYTAAPGPTDTSQTLAMTLDGPFERGEWILFLTTQGAAADVTWAAQITIS